ncbi:9938_t:CDS:2 [Paraglomus occultum]|uniref:9938_t:CDS:1 n=1 Tax=Paraglomus occultum TaxID=144539 RepID=A0A9N9H1B7_9GLOM|nr:9938_t:CDS:2 [Paraglomus occultum]
MTKGELKVIVVEAKNLKDEDLIGKSDPYVELWISKDYKQRTSTKKNTLNPIWNEDFKFNTDTHEHHLYIKVLDEDFGEDDKLGEAKVDLKQVYKKGYVDEWVKLPALLGLRSKGEVHLILEYSAS